MLHAGGTASSGAARPKTCEVSSIKTHVNILYVHTAYDARDSWRIYRTVLHSSTPSRQLSLSDAWLYIDSRKYMGDIQHRKSFGYPVRTIDNTGSVRSGWICDALVKWHSYQICALVRKRPRNSGVADAVRWH
jgi:hypothetical protein